jgi:two-component system, chemotaxis family, chemotaxis protein CheY
MAYRVLIVDDSQTMRKVIRKSIAMSGFKMESCLEAEDGLEALELLQGHGIDLILADVNMPVMNGLEMLRKLRGGGSHRDIPVILITTEGSESRLEEARALGIQGYIQKPFHPETLREVLERVLEETRA